MILRVVLLLLINCLLQVASQCAGGDRPSCGRYVTEHRNKGCAAKEFKFAYAYCCRALLASGCQPPFDSAFTRLRQNYKARLKSNVSSSAPIIPQVTDGTRNRQSQDQQQQQFTHQQSAKPTSFQQLSPQVIDKLRARNRRPFDFGQPADPFQDSNLDSNNNLRNTSQNNDSRPSLAKNIEKNSNSGSQRRPFEAKENTRPDIAELLAQFFHGTGQTEKLNELYDER